MNCICGVANGDRFYLDRKHLKWQVQHHSNEKDLPLESYRHLVGHGYCGSQDETNRTGTAEDRETDGLVYFFCVKKKRQQNLRSLCQSQRWTYTPQWPTNTWSESGIGFISSGRNCTWIIITTTKESLRMVDKKPSHIIAVDKSHIFSMCDLECHLCQMVSFLATPLTEAYHCHPWH